MAFCGFRRTGQTLLLAHAAVRQPAGTIARRPWSASVPSSNPRSLQYCTSIIQSRFGPCVPSLHDVRQPTVPLLRSTSSLTSRRHFFGSSSSSSSSPYDTLGVSKTATSAEVKMAYYKLAKKYHPDLNPGDATATQKFRSVTEAYEILSDPAKRKNYDQYGSSSNSSSSSSSNSSSSGGRQTQRGSPFDFDNMASNAGNPFPSSEEMDRHYRQVFAELQGDAAIIAEAITEYVNSLKDDASTSYDGAKRGDFAPMLDAVSRNKVPVAIAFSLFAVVRFPALIIPASAMLAKGAVRFAVSNPKGAVALGGVIWQYVVEKAKEQNRKKVEEEATRGDRGNDAEKSKKTGWKTRRK